MDGLLAGLVPATMAPHLATARGSASFFPIVPGGAAPPAGPGDEAACELLRAVACWPSASDAAQLRSLAGKIQDWDALIALARGHRVAPVLYACLSGLEIPLPESASRELHAEQQRVLLHNLASAAELVALLALFDGARIRAMPFKGVVLAATAWGDLTSRPGGDLDLLLDEQNIEPAIRLLYDRGYRLRTVPGPDGTEIDSGENERQLLRPSDGLLVELRWRLDMVSTRFGLYLGLDWVWPSRGAATLAGAAVPTLSADAALLMLCMHGCRHGWSRLVWIMDVARMAGASAGLDWDAMMREARRVGLERALALGMLLAHQVAGATLPPGPLARFAADRTALRLAQNFSANLFRAPGVSPAAYGFQLLDFRDRLRFLSQLNFLRPNERDQAVISLPRSLRALYYLIRPFRILLDRSVR
jgi:hypothetical protein